MSYNWEKIFKSKTDKELYEIFLGRKQLGAEAKKFAEVELKSRNFKFDNIDSHKKKWTLEKLIEDERNEKGPFFGIGLSWASNSNNYLFMFILGIGITVLMTLDYFFNFLNQGQEKINHNEQILFLIFFTSFSFVGFLVYRKKKKQEKRRREKIDELIKEI
ncbi:MAG: hypothetical protein KJ578_04135 [Bacteroidetes bacterium]|nr:hypothetical protein [Bacteroidota bacterium]MBU1578106.1 hypothetical protein [Bacteroidota bacterium]MBU2556951.1 hypothetical protein [Bacteroidota bacterium]